MSSCKLYGIFSHFRSLSINRSIFQPCEGINRNFLVLPPHTRDKEVHWDYHTFCVELPAGPCRERTPEAPPGRNHTFGGFSQKIFSFSPSKFFSESSSMRAAQNWAQSYWARRGYPRTQTSVFGGPCREISSRLYPRTVDHPGILEVVGEVLPGHFEFPRNLGRARWLL